MYMYFFSCKGNKMELKFIEFHRGNKTPLFNFIVISQIARCQEMGVNYYYFFDIINCISFYKYPGIIIFLIIFNVFMSKEYCTSFCNRGESRGVQWVCNIFSISKMCAFVFGDCLLIAVLNA